MIIYKIHHKETGEVYIGQTCQPLKRRIGCHMRQPGCSRLNRALRKYGMDAFTVEVIDSATSRSALNLLESAWIAAYDCVSPKGYNLMTGGSAPVVSDETRARMAEAHKGSTCSEETKAKISAANKGTVHSEEIRERMSAAHRGIPGHPQSEETRAKISATRIKLWENKRKAKEMEKP